MSLINDALKRAKQASQANPIPPPDLQFRPADSAPSRSSGLPIVPIALVMIALFLSGGFIFLALQKRSANASVAHATPLSSATAQTATSPETTIPTAVPVVASANSAPTTSPVPAPDVAPTNPVLDNDASVPDVEAGSNTVETVVAVEPPKPELPRLQGIAFNPSRPSAVVNGKTVYIGGRVGDFRVTEITAESVTIVSATQTNVLSLSE